MKLLRILSICSIIFLSSSVGGKAISVIVPETDPVANSGPVQWAVQELVEASALSGSAVKLYAGTKSVPEDSRCVLVSMPTGALAKEILRHNKLALPASAEALVITEGFADGREVLLACGTDAVGLMYAVLELADRIQCGIDPMTALRADEPIIEKPAVRVRSIYRTFTSDVEDLPWYTSKNFWRQYLTELAKNRINRFSLTFGMGYNTPRNIKDSYLFFVYPFLVEVPEYDVHAVGLPDAERDRNLEMLKFISEETAARGIDFHLGLWSHGRDWPNSEDVNYPIHGLTADNHAAYCRDALAMILQACPDISGVTFRVHSESGVPNDTQNFWEVLFEAFGEVDRPVWIDMHAKQLTQQQIDWALATGMPVSASPKYWAEHQGLAYHQANIRQREKGSVRNYVEPVTGVYENRGFTRYGYGDLLPVDRQWEVLHRIWPGTQKLLLEGDPALAAGYGRVSSFCGSLGVERLDPLAFKGRKGSGYPGGRCAYLDESLEPEWDFQKFLYTYRIWGRLVYNPQTDPEVWMRFLRHKFGQAAKPIEVALANASRVTKLITTAHGRSANCVLYWPELLMNVPIVDESKIVTDNDTDVPMVFGNVPPHDPQLFSKMNAYAEALLAGNEPDKYSPLAVAQWLEDLADTVDRNLILAEARVPDKTDVDYRRFYYDIRLQGSLARFFALKMRAAVLWHLYQESGDGAALVEAINQYTKARNVWAKMAEEVKPVYVEDITFGFAEQERGHWIDRIPLIDADIADMKAELANPQPIAVPMRSVQGAIAAVLSHPLQPHAACRHQSASTFQPGKTIPIELTLDKPVKQVILYYRHVNQAVDWQMVPMKIKGKRGYAEIPADYTKTRFNMSYYFVIDRGADGKAIYPGLDEDLAGLPYFVINQ